jgi:quercetin dioxygenase-like cupin family protein
MDSDKPDLVRTFHSDYQWDGVVRQPYKQDGTAPFRDISRQVLFDEPDMGCELRYFEMDTGGHSTLERHEHAHAVMILRGRGTCLLGDAVRPVKTFDLISIPAWTWHQLRADAGEPMGFLCMVNQQRDRPQLPTAEQLAAMKANVAVAKFLAG